MHVAELINCKKLVSLHAVFLDRSVNAGKLSTESSTFVKLTKRISSRESGCLANWRLTKVSLQFCQHFKSYFQWADVPMHGPCHGWRPHRVDFVASNA